MGNKSVKQAKAINAAKFAHLGFDADEVHALYGQFLSLKTEQGGDGQVSLAEFQAALGFKGKETSVFVERIFKLFDDNHDGLINFEEFLSGIALLSHNAPPERRLRFAFQMYDADKKERISQGDVRIMLAASLKENEVRMSDLQVDRLVDDTFRSHDLDRDGYINYEEFKNMCVKHPSILKPLTLNVSELIAQAKAEAMQAGAGAGAPAGGK